MGAMDTRQLEVLVNELFHGGHDHPAQATLLPDGSPGRSPGRLPGTPAMSPPGAPEVAEGGDPAALALQYGVPQAPVQAAGIDASPEFARVPAEVPINHGGGLALPQEIALAPEPRQFHKAAGSPSLPEGIEHDKAATEPYWLAARAAGISTEADLFEILPLTDGLEPTHVVENLPEPPKRPPPQPPSNAWMIEKLTAMSGQSALETAPPQGESGSLYWLPSSSGIKQGDKAKPAVASTGPFDVDTVRKDFPILRQKVNGKPLVWLDNAATTQKPQQVIDRISEFYERENSNVHRAAHDLAARATDAYENAREKIRNFLGAGSTEEIIFTRGTTEAINLVAQTCGKRRLGEGDEIILTEMEHHSNIVPWQHLAQETGARIVVAPFHDSGEIDLGAYERLFSKRTRVVAITHVSNALGSILPVKQMVETAHRHGAIALVDGAQSVPHFPVNMQDIGADFYALSGHKLFGPTGVGVLYGRRELLEEMPPWQGGGNMIESVTFERTTYNPPPYKFEAGTAILAAAVGLGAAVDYLQRIGFAAAARHEESLLHYGQEKLAAINGVRMIGEAREKAGVMSFVTDKVSPSEMGEMLNLEGIAVRTGHHCAQPALAHYGLTATIRPSLAFYNTKDEIDLLVSTVKRAIESKG